MREWRMCDRRFPEREARCLLGFIENRGFDYEETYLLRSGSLEPYGSLATATVSFSVN